MRGNLDRDLGRLEGKLDMLLVNQQNLQDTVEGMDGRLRAVEIRAAAHGAVGGALASLVVSIGTHILTKRLGG